MGQGIVGSCQCSLILSPAYSLPSIAIASCTETHLAPGTPDFQGSPLLLLSQSLWVGGHAQSILTSPNDSSLIFICLLSDFLTSYGQKVRNKLRSQSRLSLSLQMLLRYLKPLLKVAMVATDFLCLKPKGRLKQSHFMILLNIYRFDAYDFCQHQSTDLSLVVHCM